MNKRNEMRKARAIAEASHGLLGPLPAARVLRDHLATIIGWRCRGSSWDQIAAILNDAGWRSSKGDIVSAQTLRAMVSRIRRSQPMRSPLVTSAAIMPNPEVARHSGLVDTRPVGPASTDVAERIRRAATLRSGRDER